MSQIFHIHYSSKALNDLRNIYAYIAFQLQAPETAKRQIERIQEKICSCRVGTLEKPKYSQGSYR